MTNEDLIEILNHKDACKTFVTDIVNQYQIKDALNGLSEAGFSVHSITHVKTEVKPQIYTFLVVGVR